MTIFRDQASIQLEKNRLEPFPTAGASPGKSTLGARSPVIRYASQSRLALRSFARSVACMFPPVQQFTLSFNNARSGRQKDHQMFGRSWLTNSRTRASRHRRRATDL